MERYIRSAIHHGQAILQSDPVTANAQYDLIMEALNAMKGSPQGERTTLVSILEHPDSSVRCWAATHLLKFEPDKALQVLHRLSALPGLVGFGAEMVIQQGNKGCVP